MIRTVVGVLLAPLAVTLVVLAYFAAVAPFYPEVRDAGTLAYARYSLRPTIIFSYAGMMILGVPAHLVLRSRGRLRLRDYALAGAGLCAVPALALTGWMAATEMTGDGSGLSIRHFLPGIALDIVVLAACGATVAATFWFLTVRAR